jgi:hypothetical protein
MQLSAHHHFAATPEEVASAMVAPELVVQLVEVTDVGSVEVIDHGADEHTRWISARLTYNGSLDPIAARVLGSAQPTWVQTYRLAATGRTGHLDITPDHHGSLLQCHADIKLEPATVGTDRALRGELAVRVPLLGGRAERALMPAILARIDAEAVLLDRWLTSRR